MEKRTCSVEDCDREPKGRGWCLMHYKRWRKTDVPGEAAARQNSLNGRTCAVEGCERTPQGRYCPMHYQRVRTTGDFGPPEPIRIPRQVPQRDKPCTVDECQSSASNVGLCNKHYLRSRAREDGDLSDIPPKRECPICGVSFQPRKHGDSQLYCSPPCRGRASYLRNGPGDPGKRRSYYGKRYREDPEYRARVLESSRSVHLRRKYGLTRAAFNELLALQGGQCAICRTDKPDDTGLGWNVDHCHATGRIRGLLCRRCNGGLGWFLDNPEALRRAADYIEAHRD